MLVMLVFYEWTSILFLLDLVEYIMHLCPLLFMIQLLFCSWVYSLFVPKVHNQENISETLKLCLLYWVLFEIVLACFFSLGNNFWHKHIWRRCRGRSWRHIFLGILIFFTGLRGGLKPTLFEGYFPPKLSQWLLEEWEVEIDLLHPCSWVWQTLNRYWGQQESLKYHSHYPLYLTLSS